MSTPVPGPVPAPRPALTGEDLTLTYGARPVVHEVSLSLRPGEVTALLGPVAMLLGGVLVGIADALGRTLIAPSQVPAGLMVSLIGAPYFVWLLWRSRA